MTHLRCRTIVPGWTAGRVVRRADSVMGACQSASSNGDSMRVRTASTPKEEASALAWPPLHTAVRDRDAAKVRALLRKMTGIRKAELDERSAEGDGWSDDNPYAGATPLYIAVCAEEDGGEDTLEVLQLLIENGVDLNRPNLRGETPLSRAASLAHLGAVAKLLDAGAITEVPSPFTGLAPIFTNHEEVAKLLLKYGASCDWRDYSPEGGGSGHSFGKKPLNWALENQHDEVAALLMEADAAGAERPPDLRGYKQERVEARVGRPLDPNKPLFGSGGSDSPGAGVVFSALGLPKGMSISAATGVISGVCLVEGENNLAVTVQNAHGKRVVRVRVIAEPRDAFTYAGQPFDQGGVLYHLATNGGASPWTNPSKKGRVKVEWSAPGDGAAPGTSPMEAHLVSRPDHDGSGGDSAPGPSFTMARPTGAEDAGCWMRLDLGATRRLELTNYCLRHAGAPKPVTFVDWEASKRNRYALRTWELQGAMESAGPWTTLRKHVKDQSLESASYSMAAWEVPVVTAGRRAKPTAFRFFRLVLCGPNAAGDTVDPASTDVVLTTDIKIISLAPDGKLMAPKPPLTEPDVCPQPPAEAEEELFRLHCAGIELYGTLREFADEERAQQHHRSSSFTKLSNRISRSLSPRPASGLGTAEEPAATGVWY